MSQLAVKFPPATLSVVQGGLNDSADSGRRQIILLGLILIVIQFMDGFLTAVGVHHFGTSAEGNIIIRALMNHIGHIPALVFVKGCAILVIFNLCYLAANIPWLINALKLMIGIYLGAAIIPWSAIILMRVV